MTTSKQSRHGKVSKIQSGRWWELAAGSWLAAALDILRFMVAGNLLDSLALGQVGVFNLISAMGGYANLGLRGIATREYVHYAEKGDEHRASRSRDICLSIEGVVVVVAAVGIGTTFLALEFTGPVRFYGLLGAAVLAIRGLIGIVRTEAIIQKSYRAVGRSQIVDSAVFSVVGVALLVALGAPGFVLGATLSSLCVLAFLVYYVPSHLTFTLRWQGAGHLVKKGLSLALSSILIGVNAFALRSIMIALFGLASFGSFSLVFGLVNRANALLLSIVNADGRRFLEDLVEPGENSRRILGRFVLMGVIGAAATLFAWFLFPPFLRILVPRHVESAHLGQLLALLILSTCAGSYPGLALTSISIDFPSLLWIGRSAEFVGFLLATVVLEAVGLLSLSTFILCFVASEYAYHGLIIGVVLQRLRRATKGGR